MIGPQPPIRVLLVDDHRTVLRGLEWLINAQQPEMTVCGCTANLEDAVRLCNALKPDVLVLDLDVGGRSAAEFIPQFVHHCKTVVLVLTGVRNADAHHAAIMAGARGVVAKEAEPEMILKAIRKVHAGEVWLDRVGLQKVLTALVRDAPGPRSATDDRIVASLTPREREIIVALSANAGAPARRVAQLLDISENTLRNHLTSIYDKLGVSTRLELYEFAQKHRVTA